VVSEPVLNPEEAEKVVIALAGQPNTGKSTVFNALTGAKQHVGNWPGKTVEKKSGRFRYDDASHTVIDLPGTYSLSANSTEEVIARNFIIKKKPDLIVVVVDASQLSRSLYLVAEIVHLGVPIIVALNMMDVARVKGMKIEAVALQEALGVRVVPMTASKKVGVQDLLEAIEDTVSKDWTPPVQQFRFEKKETSLVERLQKRIKTYEPAGYRPEWIALKLLEDDTEVVAMMQKRMGAENWQPVAAMLPDDGQGALLVANARYNWISTVLEDGFVQKKAPSSSIGRTGFDKFATNPILGPILSVLIMAAGFVLVMIIGFAALAVLKPVTGLIPFLQTAFGTELPIITAFVTQAVIPAFYMIMAVASFNFSLMLFLGILEDIGYLPRMAYLADIFMSRIGLHGKSFVPLFLGFGCNIAAVMGCRVIETARQRIKTIIIASHVPCPGVMVTTAFMVGIFFGPTALLIITAMAVAVIIQIYITARLLDYTLLQGTNVGMVMELPPYHMPNWRTIGNYVWQHYKSFLQKAGSLIASIIALVWVFSYFPNGQMVDSYLASAGKIFEPLGMLVGMDWKLLTCLLVASISKEAALISMAVIFGVQVFDGSLIGMIINDSGNNSQISKEVLESTLFGAVSKPSALAFIFAVLFSMPCFATLGAIYYETKSLKWTIGSLLYYTTLSFVWAFIVYRVGLMIFQ
jgi:ferrous iron transport protein B